MYKETAKELIQFIEKSPTCFHAVASMKEILEKAGYVELKETDKWTVKKGGRYFVTRNDSSLIAFAVPEEGMKGFRIMASHSDSPCFKIKENPEMTVDNKYVKLNVERYGGMICQTVVCGWPCDCKRGRKTGDKAGGRGQRFAADPQSGDSHEPGGQ